MRVIEVAEVGIGVERSNPRILREFGQCLGLAVEALGARAVERMTSWSRMVRLGATTSTRPSAHPKGSNVMRPVLPHPTGICSIAGAPSTAKYATAAAWPCCCGSRSRVLFPIDTRVPLKNALISSG